MKDIATSSKLTPVELPEMADFAIEVFPKKGASDSDQVLKFIMHLPTGIGIELRGTNLETNEKIKEWVKNKEWLKNKDLLKNKDWLKNWNQ